MSKKPAKPAPLRSKAEKKLAHEWPMDTNAAPIEEIIHELQVHELELEMQNENLRQSEIALEISRDRYIDFYDFAPVGYLTLSSNGLIIEANLTCATMLGIERSKLLQNRFSRFVVPENNDDWYRHFMAALQHDGKQSCELDVRCGHEGHLHVLLDSLRLLKDNLEPMVRITLTDITRLKIAEIALHKSEEYLRLLEQREIIQTSLDGFWVVDAQDTRIIEVNDAFCSMVGYSREELLTMRIADLEVDVSPAEITACIKEIIKIGHDRFETRHRHKLGHLVDLEVSVSLSEVDGGILFVFSRDITARKHADKLLRRSYEEIKDLYNNAACGYHSLDENGIICRINDTELAWLGYTRDEIIGKVRFPDLMTSASRQTFNNSFPQLKSTGFANDLEIDLIRKDGIIFNGLINATAIYDPGGNYVMSRSALTDISKLKQAQQQLHDLTAHIQSVREEEKMHLAREIHDDLGGTLAAIKIEANRIKRELPDNKRITGRIDSMSEMIASAMAFTRHIITDLRPSILDDLGLMAALEWQAAEFYKRTGIECRIDCSSRKNNGCATCKDCELKLGKTLSINLFRIFQEALTNVSRHSGASRVVVEYRPCEDEAALSISDDGCGLPEDHTIANTSYGDAARDKLSGIAR